MILVFFTETWLRDEEAEAVWVQCSDLCINEYNFFTHQIVKTDQEEVLRLVVNKDFSTILLEEGAKTSFQYAKWSVSCKNRVLKIHSNIPSTLLHQKSSYI